MINAIRSEFKSFEEKKAYLDNLFYNVGKQVYDFDVFFMEEKNNRKSLWKKWSEVGFDVENWKNHKFIEESNNRTILGNEVVLDLEEPKKFNKIMKKLKADKLFYRAFRTGSRGYHIHLIYDKELEPEDKLEVIKDYDCDTQKTSKRCGIALEFCPHWKTGKPKELIFENDGINKFIKKEKVGVEGEEKEIFVENFLNIIYNNKGEIKSKNVDIDKVAHYLKEKYNFKTIFGKKNDYVWSYNNGIYQQEGRGIIKTDCEKLLETYARRNIVDEIFEKIKRLTKIDREDFEKTDINLIPLRNGLWDIKGKELIGYKPEYNFKFIIDIEKDKNAKCPKWIKFINEALYPDDIPVAQEFFGFNLYREYFIKKGVIGVGPQDTGKSVFLDTLTKFVGEKNKTGISLQKITGGTDFTKLSLKDKHSNIYDDLSSKDLNDGGAFKIATGGGFISGEEKFGDFSQFRSFAKQIFATNKIPPVKDNDDLAYFGRWIILKFDNVPEKIDPFLRDKLWTDKEMSGILNWALEGLYRLLKKGSFSYDKTPAEIKRIMEESGCPLVLFSNEVLQNEDGNIITKDEMYKVYSIWAKTSQKPRLSKEQLGRQLMKYCPYILAEKHKKRVWKNAKFNDEIIKNYDLSVTTYTSDTFKKTLKSISKESNKSIINNVDMRKNKASVVSKEKQDRLRKIQEKILSGEINSEQAEKILKE